MFEHVATIPVVHPRQPLALLAAHAAVGAALLLLVALSATPVAVVLGPPEPLEVPVEIRTPAPASPGAAPVAKAAPRPRRSTPQAAALPTLSAPLARSTPASSDLASGVTPAEVYGEPGECGDPSVCGPLVVGGPGGGPGAGPGDGGGGLRDIDGGAVRVRYQRQPEYPAAAAALGIQEAICTVRIVIDPRGVPSEVYPVSCPPPFVAATRSAAMKWRFHPVREGGVAVPARFVLRVRYQLR